MIESELPQYIPPSGASVSPQAQASRLLPKAVTTKGKKGSKTKGNKIESIK
jgi:hypothetical protein